MTDTIRVRSAIENLKKNNNEFYNKCIKQRLFNGGEGSYYPYDKLQLETLLEMAEWEKVEHPNVTEPCSCFVSYDFKGRVGVVELENLHDDIEFFLDDFKNTGWLSLCVKQDESWFVPLDYTYIILGDDGFGEIMFTFHPGEPIAPSTLEDGKNEFGLEKGMKLTKEEAIKYGFKHAKVVRV